MSLFYTGDPNWRKVKIEHDGNFHNMKVTDVETGQELEDVYRLVISIARNQGMVEGAIQFMKGSGQSISRDGVVESPHYSVLDNSERVQIVEIVFKKGRE